MATNRASLISKIRIIRLALGGALLGVAVTSSAGMVFGFDQHHTILDTFGAVGGAAAAAVAIKLVHLV